MVIRWLHCRAAACLAALALLASIVPAAAQAPNPHAIALPPWFVETFLDVRDDIREAAAGGRRLMLYFGQDGCPYCRELMQTGFGQRRIADKARQGLLPVALDIWGDRPVTWLDGKAMPEKELARVLKVQYTPTLLFFDEKGTIVARVNGYYPPHRLEAVIDFVIGRLERRVSLADHLATAAKEAAGAELNDAPFLMKPGTSLARRPGGKPLAVLFETRHCAACDEMHREGFRRPELQPLLARFDIARFALTDATPLTTPDGRAATAAPWARELGVHYAPSIVFFDAAGREVFRIEAYLRPFHLTSAFEYVATGAYREQPSFQRFIQARAERTRAKSGRVELWK